MERLKDYALGDVVKFRWSGKPYDLPIAGTVVLNSKGEKALEVNIVEPMVYELTERDVIVSPEEMEVNYPPIIKHCQNQINEFEERYRNNQRCGMLDMDDIRENKEILKNSIYGCGTLGLIGFSVCEILEERLNEVVKNLEESKEPLRESVLKE